MTGEGEGEGGEPGGGKSNSKVGTRWVRQKQTSEKWKSRSVWRDEGLSNLWGFEKYFKNPNLKKETRNVKSKMLMKTRSKKEKKLESRCWLERCRIKQVVGIWQRKED